MFFSSKSTAAVCVLCAKHVPLYEDKTKYHDKKRRLSHTGTNERNRPLTAVHHEVLRAEHAAKYHGDGEGGGVAKVGALRFKVRVSYGVSSSLQRLHPPRGSLSSAHHCSFALNVDCLFIEYPVHN